MCQTPTRTYKVLNCLKQLLWKSRVVSFKKTLREHYMHCRLKMWNLYLHLSIFEVSIKITLSFCFVACADKGNIFFSRPKDNRSRSANVSLIVRSAKTSVWS